MTNQPPKMALKIRQLSKKLVKVQKPIRILNAIKWNDDVKHYFFKHKQERLPPLGQEYYQTRSLGFEPGLKKQELGLLKKEIEQELGFQHPAGKILLRNVSEYIEVVKMLERRGTQDFYAYSKDLFGSTSDTFSDGVSKISELGILMEQILEPLLITSARVHYEKKVEAQVVVKELNQRLGKYFKQEQVSVKLDDGILSDASAGSDYVKIKRGAVFSERDIDIFEVHEGQVHVGTTMNGKAQSYALWLSKGPPCTMATQEGLAILMEILTMVCLPERAQRINNRILAIKMAEEGAGFIDVYRFYKEKGLEDEDAFRSTERAFRGGVVSGGAPFTKDVSYGKGFIMVYNFLRGTIGLGRPELVPFLWCGKVHLEDIPLLYQLAQEKIVDPPKHMPEIFRDLNGIAVWMSYSNFLNRMSLDKISQRILKVAA